MRDAAIPPLVEHLFRTESARLTTLLTRLLGPAHLELAEDVTQEAFIAALRHWPRTGTPAAPAAWLLQVARRRALDVLRRDRALADRLPAIAGALDEAIARAEEPHGAIDDGPFADDQLRMILLCCHPAVSPESRVALTLKTVGGMSVGEIARAFLAEESAVAQRLVRAKRSLRQADARFEMPEGAALVERLDSVLDVLYLLFNEGHLAHEGEELLREELGAEAIRLAELLLTHPATRTPRTSALAALFCFHASRFRARVDPDGALVRLPRQDRTLWDGTLIARGFAHLAASASGDEVSAFHVEAEIASLHAIATTWEETDWARIVAAYDVLLAMNPSPVVGLNRVVAVRELSGPEAALAELGSLARRTDLEGYHLHHAVLADLLTALGRPEEARRAWERARALVRSAPGRRFVDSQLSDPGTMSIPD